MGLCGSTEGCTHRLHFWGSACSFINSSVGLAFGFLGDLGYYTSFVSIEGRILCAFLSFFRCDGSFVRLFVYISGVLRTVVGNQGRVFLALVRPVDVVCNVGVYLDYALVITLGVSGVVASMYVAPFWYFCVYSGY